MSEKLNSFSLSMTKVAKERNKQSPSYPSQIVALAPAGAVSAAFDYPKGWIDKKVESKITGVSGKAGKRGLGRAAGRFGGGLLTTPLFISGIKDIKNAETKEDKQKGMAKIIGAGASFSGIKGGIEAGIEGGGFKKAIKKVKDIATVRGVIGAAAAAGTGYSIAQNLKNTGKKSKKQKTPRDMMVQALPTAAAGAAIGATKGGVETAFLNRKNINKFVKDPKKFLGPVAGRAAAGALGAVVLSEVAKRTMSKVGSVGYAVTKMQESKKEGLFDPPGALYFKTRAWAAKRSDVQVKAAYGDTVRRGAERSPSSRAVYYALHDSLEDRGYKPPQPKMRDKVSPPSSKDYTTGATIITASLLAPHLVGGVVDNMDPDKKDILIRDALDSIAASKGIDVYDSDNPKFWDDLGLSSKIGPHMSADSSGKTYIATPKNKPEIMAHELGHATAGDFRKKFLQTHDAKALFRFGKVMNILIPAAVVATSADSSFSTKEERQAKADFLKGTGVVGTAFMAPVLGEEAMASLKAGQLLAKAEVQSDLARKGMADVPKSVVNSAKRVSKLLPAFGTYASAAAIPFLLAKYIERDTK